uniref:Endo/exonuclease/phosphatase domain-containing protein n=1 Tax=Haemonchus contortus TaxID=6289 RepID=A0A7I5E8S9_HAECO
MDCLFVCWYNGRTIASEASLRMLLLSSRLVKYDVIAQQETKGRTEIIQKTDHNELLIIGPKADGNVGGVGFLINSTIAHLVDSHNFVSPRLAVLRLRTKVRVAISIINVYAPTAAAAEEEREEFNRLLEKTIREEKSYYKYVVGDFNAVVGTNCSLSWKKGEHSNRILTPTTWKR